MTKSIVTPQNLIRSKQRKEFLFFCKKSSYYKHVKTEKNPQVVKHVVNDCGNGYLPYGQGVVAPSIFVLFPTIICGRSSREPTVIRGFRETHRHKSKNPKMEFSIFGFLVEATGLEPTTSWSLTKRATKLRYASISFNIISLIFCKVKHFFVKTQKNIFFLKIFYSLRFSIE